MNPDEVNQFFAQIPTGLICYVAVFFVGLFGLMVYFGIIKPARARRKLNSLDASQAASAVQSPSLPAYQTPSAYSPAPVRATRPGEYRVKLSDGHVTEAREVLAVARDLEDDRLLVYVDGVGYRSMVDSPETKARFTALMRELAETIAKPDAPRPAAPVISPADLADLADDTMGNLPDLDDYAGYEDDLDLPDVDLLTAPTFSEPSQMTPPSHTPPASRPPRPAATSSIPPAADGSMPGTLPSYRPESESAPLKRQGIFRTPKVDLQPIPELNLANAIEAYLQHKLNFTPEYVDRDLHVHAAPGGGVRIQVDNRYYDAVSDIEDETVRTFIAETIQEWQERQ
jgi:hypothetical protein